MNRINNNNLDALRVFFSASQSKKAENEEAKKDTVKKSNVETKQVQASALDAAAAQIWGAQLSKVDKSDRATERRVEEFFANSSAMKILDELQEDEFDFVQFAMANINGVNHEKLAKYLEKPLSPETIGFVENL